MYGTLVFIAAKVGSNPSAHVESEWRNKMYYILKMQYYSVLKEEENSDPWMNPEDIMICEINQIQKE